VAPARVTMGPQPRAAPDRRGRRGASLDALRSSLILAFLRASLLPAVAHPLSCREGVGVTVSRERRVWTTALGRYQGVGAAPPCFIPGFLDAHRRPLQADNVQCSPRLPLHHQRGMRTTTTAHTRRCRRCATSLGVAREMVGGVFQGASKLAPAPASVTRLKTSFSGAGLSRVGLARSARRVFSWVGQLWIEADRRARARDHLLIAVW